MSETPKQAYKRDNEKNLRAFSFRMVHSESIVSVVLDLRLFQNNFFLEQEHLLPYVGSVELRGEDTHHKKSSFLFLVVLSSLVPRPAK